MPNLKLYVQGVPLCGRNEKFYIELKEKLFSKSVLELKQESITNSIKENHIFEYLDLIRKKNDLVFIKFEPKDSHSHKSKLNLSGDMNFVPHDTSALYTITFADLFNQASKMKNYVRIHIPNEYEQLVDNFYLFALKRKEDKLPDRYFWDKFGIKLVRDKDMIVGVVIKKAATTKPATNTHARKRKTGETSNMENDISNKKQRVLSQNEDARKPFPQLKNMTRPSSLNQTHFSSALRDPRLATKAERENKKKASTTSDQNSDPLLENTSSLTLPVISQNADKIEECAPKKEANRVLVLDASCAKLQEINQNINKPLVRKESMSEKRGNVEQDTASKENETKNKLQSSYDYNKNKNSKKIKL